jgi:hypothetical protein
LGTLPSAVFDTDKVRFIEEREMAKLLAPLHAVIAGFLHGVTARELKQGIAGPVPAPGQPRE